MKLTFVYIILAINFAVLAILSVPRNGCYKGICIDFQAFDVTTYVFFSLAIVFSLLALLRLLKKVNLNQIHKYDSKDLNNFDG
tara:strand:+ start:66 stop:314 length:249 start_codon:yes stop_codon:yes gene_type:complete